MTQYEKELIAKIQISQLVTDDPYTDDFYYKVFSLLNGKGGAGTPVSSTTSSRGGLNWQQSMLMTQKEGGRSGTLNISTHMQNQMQRLIEGRKQKPKGTSLALEGALGKISLTSVKNPKQLIQIQEHSVPSFAHLSQKKVLRTIEDAYVIVLNLEQLKRKPPADDEVEKWNQDFDENSKQLWSLLGLSEPVAYNMPHPLAYFLSYPKGKRIFPRVTRFLLLDQMIVLFTALLSRLESLDVCNLPCTANGEKPHEEVEIFMTNCLPPLVGLVSELPMHILNSCMRLLLERHNMVWLAKSKVGLAILTMFLSRAEILKQGGAQQGVPHPTESDLAVWTDYYNFLFGSLHTHFASIFPKTDPASAPVQSSVESASTASPQGRQTPGQSTASSDEVYLWQFLAALAVGATTVDHQKVLVSEVREKVIETSKRNDNPKAIANVNLFLNALGLGIDAAQLAAMP
ncbi:topoisomerase II-associated protein PAT1 [Polychytrium aggregatum]|uniref:topoisomerase II-associated protein PAT1 n=1 Tax=Polychytrium aggregatum TaxID=110093 RepID=UPI0022FEED9A|nr:topoisomerase II-associated protein PAT1 [Polychytrium aggregatum]KAI9205767.1 topoisomerase II-associated protein PAT1 [Polychytrium aggregatum]